jgi:hypothetical protein
MYAAQQKPALLACVLCSTAAVTATHLSRKQAAVSTGHNAAGPNSLNGSAEAVMVADQASKGCQDPLLSS